MRFILLALGSAALLIVATAALPPHPTDKAQNGATSLDDPKVIFGVMPDTTTSALQANFALPEDAIQIGSDRFIVADTKNGYIKQVSGGVVSVVAGNGSLSPSKEEQGDVSLAKTMPPLSLAPYDNGYLAFSPSGAGVNYISDGRADFLGAAYTDRGRELALNFVKFNQSLPDGVYGIDGTQLRNYLVRLGDDGTFSRIDLGVNLVGKSIMGFDFCGSAVLVAYRDKGQMVTFASIEDGKVTELFQDRPYSNAIKCIGPGDFIYGARWELKRYTAGKQSIVSGGFVHIANIRPALDDPSSFIVTDSDAETISRVWLDGRSEVIATSKGQHFSDALIRMQTISDGVLAINPDGVMFKLHPDTGDDEIMFDPAGDGVWGPYLGGHHFVSLRAFYYDEPNAILYLASNHAIFRLDTDTGQFDLFAGSETEHGNIDGPAESARFAVIRDLVIYDGHLIVADAWNNKIRSIDLASRIVRSIVGSGRSGATFPTAGCRAARSYNLNHPLSVEIFEGRLIVADSFSHDLISVRPDGYGAACPYAGALMPSKDQYGGAFANGLRSAARFNGPLNLERTPCGLLVADIWNNAIRLVSNGAVSTVYRDGKEARMVSSTAYDDGALLFSSSDATVKQIEFCP